MLFIVAQQSKLDYLCCRTGLLMPCRFVIKFLSFRHIPKAKATTIAETPELKRITENTKLQSNVKYHAEFEKTKGKLTQV